MAPSHAIDDGRERQVHVGQRELVRHERGDVDRAAAQELRCARHGATALRTRAGDSEVAQRDPAPVQRDRRLVGIDPHEGDPAAQPRVLDGRGGRWLGSRALQRHVGAHAVGQLEHPLGDVFVDHVDGDVRAEPQPQLESLGPRSGDDDRPRAHESGQHDAHQPDGTGARDDDRLAPQSPPIRCRAYSEVPAVVSRVAVSNVHVRRDPVQARHVALGVLGVAAVDREAVVPVPLRAARRSSGTSCTGRRGSSRSDRQPLCGSAATRSPTAKPVAFSPSATIVPAYSWPKMNSP